MGSIENGTKQQSSWQDIVAQKRQSAEALIPKKWKLPASILDTLKFPLDKHPNKLIGLDIPKKSGLLTERELDITGNYAVAELLAKLASGDFTSLEVVTAFSKRAAIAQQLTSCLTETFFDKAFERAKYLDKCRSEGKLLGPLHGLPISLKDGFQIVGTEASIGYVSFLGKKSTTNAPLVDILLSLGAVLYVKTNIPQTLMTADSDNNIFGRTLNPHNTFLNAGGSSGGEGALVAFRGSPLGVGTDVAGSVRIPALCCGTYGFKPTASRIPYGGQQIPALAGWKPITASAGPLTNDFDALEIFVKSVMDATPALLDSTAIDVPWRALEPKDQSKLRIGVLHEDPLYPLHPPIKRTLAEVAKKLEAAGHELVPLTVQEGRVSDMLEVAFELFVLHTGTSMGNIKASGEPMVPSVAKADKPANYGNYAFVPNLKDLDFVHKYASLSVLRSELSENWRKIWLEKKLDAVLAPSAQHTAVPHDHFGWPPYTAVLNLLDYPACVIPYGKASKQVDTEAVKMPAGQAQYAPDALEGAPCSVQVFTRGFRDEECLRVSRIVDECLRQA